VFESETMMSARDFDLRLLSAVQLALVRGRWHVTVCYGEQCYTLGEWGLYVDAYRACSLSALEKALSSPEKRTLCQVAGAER
jgi:hypothetical protein